VEIVLSQFKGGIMKLNHLSTLAAVLACSMASAQSGPTIYGVADLSAESVKAEGATAPGSDISSRIRLNANSSLLGIKGKVIMDNGATVLYGPGGGGRTGP
jgi:predicted porin